MIRDRREDREGDRASRSPELDDDHEGFDRDAAEERSRGALRAAFPGLDAERHAELDRKRAKPLPYRAQLERAFGRDFGDVQAHTGMADELAPLGAQAMATGNTVAFAEEQPSPALVAHEATHVVQNAQAGAAAPMAAGVVAPRESDAEAEADRIATRVETQGLGERLPPITAPPAAHVHFSALPGAPLGRRELGEETQAFGEAVRDGDAKKILEILERNADPHRMHALISQWPQAFIVGELKKHLSDTQWARARVFLGDQVPLHMQLDARDDSKAVFRDLEKVSDAHALSLFEMSAWADWTFLVTPLDDAGTQFGPAPTTLAQVKDALKRRLKPDDYYKAMRLLLSKADRAIAVRRANPPPPPGLDPGGMIVLPADVTMPIQDPNGSGPLALDVTARARVDLAEERIRAADADWTKSESQAWLALADLSRDERKALVMRLRDQPLANFGGGLLLEEAALVEDDATAIRNAILASFYAAYFQGKANNSIGLAAATERAGELVRAARQKLRDLPENAPEAERKKAQEEVERLETMFFADRFSGAEGAYETQIAVQSGADTDDYIERLKQMGADPVTIGRERLHGIDTGDVEQLITTLKQIAPEHRLAAMQASGRLDELPNWLMSADQQEYVGALLGQGLPRTDEPLVLAPDQEPVGAPIALPVIVGVPLIGGTRPEVTIAIHEILRTIDLGPHGIHIILARVDRMPAEDRKAVFDDPRIIDKVAALPDGDFQSEEYDFKDTLKKLLAGQTINKRNFPGPGGTKNLIFPDEPGPWQAVQFERHREIADKTGQANLRRAFVLEQRRKWDPDLKLTPEDEEALKQLNEIRIDHDNMDSAAKRTSQDIAFGEPQLMDTPEAALDPNMEAGFMYYRLRQIVNAPEGKSLTEYSTGSPDVAEALTAFDTLFTLRRPGGFNRGDLAELAELYYRAMREHDTYAKAKAENEMLAQIAATVAGVVVAVAITAVSMGTLAPVAVAGLAAISAGTASMLAGAAVRWEDTPTTMWKDFGTGAVEGATAVAGAALAAKVVRGTSLGVSAGRAAIANGGRAVGKATGGAGVAIAEAMIEGAVGGAAGELFSTAVDEATWDRGVGEAIAKMFAAIARGGALGAAGGAVASGTVAGLGKLAARLGGDVAQGVGHLLDSSGVARKVADDLSEAGQDELAHAYRLVEGDQLEEAEKVIRGIDGLSRESRDLMIAAARARAAMPAPDAIGPIEIDGDALWPRMIPDKEFASKYGRGDALVVVEGGKPTIVARKGAPHAAIREEVMHLYQWQTDAAMRLKMDRLSKESLEGYGDLPFDKKLELHIDKLEVEADAQRKIIDQLVAAGERNADSQILDAEETLFLIGERLKKLYASRGLSDDKLAKLGLDKTPRLFSLGEHSADEIAGPAAKRALDQVGKSIDDADVQKILSEDYTFHRHNETGPIFRITRKPGRGDTVPHLQLEGRSIKKGKGRTNAAEQESDAALEWNTSQQQLAEMQKLADEGTATADQQVWLQHAAPAFRTELADRIAKNTMDEATAGMLCKWGHTLEQIESRSGGQYTVAYFLKHFDTLDGALSSRMSGFRDNVRMSTCDYLMTIGSPRERCDALYGLLDSMPAGDSRTRGEVFTEFRRRVMELEVDADELAIYDVEPMLPNGKVAKPVPFTGDDLANTRTADAVVDVRSEVEAHLPAGRYAIEDKTGKGAFKLDQAEDYAKRSSETIARRAEGDLAKGAATGGFRQTADGTESVYDGIVYVFSRSSEAQAALRKMAENDLVAPLLGRHPGGIHVFQFNEHGLLEAATARSWAP